MNFPYLGVLPLRPSDIRHTGVGHEDDPPGVGSGRKPWGSGDRPYQHDINLIGRDDLARRKLVEEGITDKSKQDDILAKGFGFVKEDGSADLAEYNRYLEISKKRMERLPRDQAFVEQVEKRREELRKQGVTSQSQQNQIIATEMGLFKRDKKTGQYIEGEGSAKALAAQMTISGSLVRRAQYEQARDLYDIYHNKVKVAEIMGIGDTQVGNLLRNGVESTDRKLAATLALEDELTKRHYVSVGEGVAEIMGVPQATLDGAVEDLVRNGGYSRVRYTIPQSGRDGQSTQAIALSDKPQKEALAELMQTMSLAQPPGVYFDTTTEEFHDRSKIKINEVSRDRIYVRYSDDPTYSGKEKDGVVELREGVRDLDLGMGRYAQVRIGVEGHLYMKGMAVYGDDIPEGYDIVYNSKYPRGTPDSKVFKEMKTDKETGELESNPFGTAVKVSEDQLRLTPRYYYDEDGKPQVSAINIVKEAGDIAEWSPSVASQMLSKQRPAVAKQQMDQTIEIKKEQLAELLEVSNPTIRRLMLADFADRCESQASDLDAIGFSSQTWSAILPCRSLGENECYAPNYPDGARVAMIRYPHAGTFEILELTNNLHNQEARKMLGTNPPDAVAIPPSRAGQLSGADFDGDTVLAINNTDGRIEVGKMIKELAEFESTADYALPGGKNDPRHITEKQRDQWMGRATNLIMDMTLLGSAASGNSDTHYTQDEIVRAAKFSMVVIDAYKHHLDLKQAYQDFKIAELQRKFQPHEHDSGGGGAHTIVTRAGSEAHVPARKEGQIVTDPETGAKHRQYYDEQGRRLYEETGDTKTSFMRKVVVPVTDADGNPVLYKNGKPKTRTEWIKKEWKDPVTGKPYDRMSDEELEERGVVKKVEGKTVKITQMAKLIAEGGDPFKLTSGGSRENPGTLMEAHYAQYATDLIDLAQAARRELMKTPELTYVRGMKDLYRKEVEEIEEMERQLKARKPLETMAQSMARDENKQWERDHPEAGSDDKKKHHSRVINEKRELLGLKRLDFVLTDRQWEAIQSGAVGSERLKEIWRKCDQDRCRELLWPNKKVALSPQRISRVKEMSRNGASNNMIASALDIPLRVVHQVLQAKEGTLDSTVV